MRIEFTAEIAIDRAGYEISDIAGHPGGATLMDPPVEPHSVIVAKSGVYDRRTYTAGKGAAAWKTITKIKSVEQVIYLFSKFGPLLLPSGQYKDGRDWWYLGDVLEAVEFIKHVSSRKENIIQDTGSGGLKELRSYIDQGRIFSHASGYLDRIGREGILKIDINLYQHFVLTEMMMEMGVNRRNVEVLKNCEHCGMQFTAGGGRGGASGLGLRKLDARFCSPACAKAASYQRRKAITCADG